MSVFISHSEKDKVIVDPFVDLLQTGADLSQKNIFCTSLAGLGIPTGKNFIDFIREKVSSAKLTIMIVSPSYYESVFCMCELGATWVLQQEIFPLLIPPLQYDDLKAVLKGIQVGYINDSEALDNLYDILIEKEFVAKNIPRWGKKRDAFIKEIAPLETHKKITGLTSVKSEVFSAINDKYNLILETNQKNEEIIEQPHNQIEELRQCKDKEESSAIMLKYSSENDIFQSLAEKVRETLSLLSSSCIDVLFCYTTGGCYSLPPRFGNEDIHEAIGSDIQERYLECEEDYITVNTDHPKIRRAIKALDKLQNFIIERLSENSDLISSFEDENDYPFDFSNREFWRDYLER
jgi:hypothetical protein